jgi:hypothetical protein
MLALVIVAPALVIGPWAYAASTASEIPTITFTATGTPPVVCGTRPNVTNLLIRHGTRIIIANRSGVTATIDVGRRRLIELPDGSGARVRLRLGQHELQMIPNCVMVSETETAAVNVLTASELSELGSPTPTVPPDVEGSDVGATIESTEAPSPSSPATWDASTTGVEGASTTSVEVASTTGVESVPTTPTRPDATTTPAGSAVDARAAPPVVQRSPDAADVDAVTDLEAIRLDDPTDPKGLRLLGAIATICVLGVTAAIIRAIVSERTTGSVG